MVDIGSGFQRMTACTSAFKFVREATTRVVKLAELNNCLRQHHAAVIFITHSMYSIDCALVCTCVCINIYTYVSVASFQTASVPLSWYDGTVSFVVFVVVHSSYPPVLSLSLHIGLSSVAVAARM